MAGDNVFYDTVYSHGYLACLSDIQGLVMKVYEGEADLEAVLDIITEGDMNELQSAEL